MNREIKFRAWLPVQERMIDSPYHFTTAQEPETRIAPFVCYEDWRDLEDGRGWICYIMQFTGLRDKNNNHIYEGDIVSDGFEKAVVSWFKDECQFLAFNEHELSGFNDPQVLGDWAEVIGNIYKNPELIN